MSKEDEMKEAKQKLLAGSFDDDDTTTASIQLDSTPRSASLTKVILACLLATMCNVAFGYDVGVVSGSLGDMGKTLNLSTFEKEASTSGLNFLAGFGALLISGNILDKVGRKNTILFSAILLLVGAAVVSLAQDFWMLLAGRALQGFGSGCSWVACSVYITELAPTRLRGALVALADISINLGILIGYCMDYGIAVAVHHEPNYRWRTSMAFSALFPLFYVLAYPCVSETPRYLTSKGRDEEALRVLRNVTCIDKEDNPEKILEDLKASAKESGDHALSWSEVLCVSDKSVRSAISIALLLGPLQQITGTEAILYYTPTVLKGDNLDNVEIFYANLAVGGCKLIGELISAYLVECTGRRRLMIFGNLAMSLAIFGIATSFYLDTSSLVTVVCLSLVMLTFSIGAGPFTFVVVNEMVPLRYRGKTVAASVFFNRLTSGTVALTFLTLKNAINADNAFFLYGGICFLVTVVYYLIVPDTTGISLEDLGAKLEHTNRADDAVTTNKKFEVAESGESDKVV